MAGWGEMLGELLGNAGSMLINSAVKPGGIKKNFLPTFIPAVTNMAAYGLANYAGNAFDNWMNPQGFMPQGPYPGGTGYNPYERPLPPNPYPYGQVPPNPLPRQDGTYLPNTNIPIQEVNPWVPTPGPNGYTASDWNNLNFPPSRYNLPLPDYSSKPYPTGRGEWLGPKPKPDPTYGWLDDAFKPQPKADPSQWKDFAQQHPNTDAGWRAWDLKNWEQENAAGLEEWFVPQRPGQQRPPLDRSRFLVPTTPSYGYGSDDFVNPKPLPPYNPNISPDFLKPLNIPGEKPYIPQGGKVNYHVTPQDYKPQRYRK